MSQENQDRVDRQRTALLLVDIQPDFMPGGPLAVPGGDEILGPVERLVEADLFGLYVATQDWHPPDHVSFASNHEGHLPMETIELHGHEQILWPDHCVQDTPGAVLHPELDWTPVAAIIRKGMQPDADSYSGFANNYDPQGVRPRTGLAGYLRERGIQRVAVCGLARDVCVRWTALDAADLLFDTLFVWDLTRPVDSANDETVRSELEQKGVRIVQSADLFG